MFKFEKEQKIFEIAGVKVGGQPGQLPTVMMGSIFFHGDKLVKDDKEGIFDREKAVELLRKEEEISARTGNPRIIDVVGAWPKAIERYIDFIADATKSPFLIDGVSPDARMAGAKHASEVGLKDRAIYNTISFETKQKEIDAIKAAGLSSAIVLAFNPEKLTIEGRMEMLKGTPTKKSLLDIAKEAGIEKMLIDPATLDMPDVGPIAKAIHLFKKEYGFPAGCGAHNAVDVWVGRKKLDPTTHLISNVVANVTPILMGANFALYGPLDRAAEIYHAVGLADAYVAYCMRQEYKIEPLTKEHPLFKIFR